MSKSVKIQDSPEFKEFKENFEATMDVMEKDPEFAQMKLPEKWEQDFKETMEATWEEERQKKKKRIGKRIAIAAGVTLVTLAGLNLGVQQVQGEGLVEFFQKTFHLDGKQYTTFDAGKNVEFQVDTEDNEIVLSHESLSCMYRELQNVKKTAILEVLYVPPEYEIEDAKFDRLYDFLNVKLIYDEGYIYIYQQQQTDETAQGYINEEEICSTVFNTKIGVKIPIYRSIQDNNLTFSIKYGYTLLSVKSNLSLEECEKIAESIDVS